MAASDRFIDGSADSWTRAQTAGATEAAVKAANVSVTSRNILAPLPTPTIALVGMISSRAQVCVTKSVRFCARDSQNIETQTHTHV